MTLPKHQRSGRTPDHAEAPPSPSRNPVMTSSKISSAPAASHAARSPSRNPVDRRDQAHVGGHRLDDDAGHLLVELGHRVVGDHDGVGHRRRRDAGRVGQPERGHPAAPAGQQPVGVAVVAAGELHDPGPAGEAPGHPDGAHRRLGPRRHQPHLLAARRPGRRSPRPAGPHPRSAPRRWCPAGGGSARPRPPPDGRARGCDAP